MTQLTRHPAYLLIEDQLDAMGQKYRIVQILRGAMLFVCLGILSIAAAFAAHFTRESRWTSVVLGLWIAWIIASAFWWFVRPLLIRPRALQMARLIETRIAGLNNGLTNSVLLARADDFSKAPGCRRSSTKSSSTRARAARVAGCGGANPRPRPLGLRLVRRPPRAAAGRCSSRRPSLHGWHQLFSPTHFVPQAAR